MPVMEVVLFRTKPGTDKRAFDAVVDSSQRFLAGQPGFLRRDLAQAESGEWVDLVRWADSESARRAGELFMTQPCAAEFEALLEQEGMRMLHTGPVRAWPAE